MRAKSSKTEHLERFPNFFYMIFRDANRQANVWKYDVARNEWKSCLQLKRSLEDYCTFIHQNELFLFDTRSTSQSEVT